jgi:tetratricopeptide (TPR) repeat protein
MLACMLTGCVFPTERWKTEEHLAMANDYLARGDFSAALTESRTALDLYPQLLGDRALFQIGLIYGHPGNPQRNVAKAREAFRDVTTRYPESQLAPQAEMWIQVLGNLQGLEAAVSAKDRELDRLAEQLRNEQRKARKRQAQEKKIVESKEDNLEKAIEDKDRQIKELEEDIDQLKEVDIKIDEKKRKVTP